MARPHGLALRVVLDTSVLLSAERRPLLLLAAQQRYTLVWSPFIADEVARKLVEMGWRAATARELVTALVDLAEMVDHSQITGGNYDRWLRDPDDHPILATALIMARLRRDSRTGRLPGDLEHPRLSAQAPLCRRDDPHA